MNIFSEKKNCCGCTACMTVCPEAAITMCPDEKGFLYPVVDSGKCVNCGLCMEVCSFSSGCRITSDSEFPIAYAVRHKDECERKTSRSGGMFPVLVDWILKVNGVIYGAGYGDDFYVMHKRVETKEAAFEFKGSKYVQSDMNTVYSQVIDDLSNGRYVLFSGTPCQTAGLYSSLKNVSTDRLFVCDIVCHGTPSPMLFRDYLGYMKKRYKSEISAFDFRNKAYGWNAHIETVSFANGKKVSKRIYTDLFYKHVALRPSCGVCGYTNLHRPSDITLADFWGIDNAVPGFNDNKGVSLVLVNTEKGKAVFDAVKEKIDSVPTEIKNCMQPNLEKPSVFSPDTENFWKDYFEYGFEFAAKKYGAIDQKKEIKLSIKKLLLKTGILKM